MNYHENIRKMIYHKIYKIDLYTLKLFKKDNNKKDAITPVFIDVFEKEDLSNITVEKIEVEKIEVEIPENKILFKGENNIITSDMIKSIYNIDIYSRNYKIYFLI
jgi:hypothetical protein